MVIFNGSAISPLVAFPLVILPPNVALDMLDMLVSEMLVLCAFTEFNPTIANLPIMAQELV